MKLHSIKFYAVTVCLKWHDFIQFASPCSFKSYIYANDINVISIHRQKLHLAEDLYLWYRKFYIIKIQSISANLDNAPYGLAREDGYK